MTAVRLNNQTNNRLTGTSLLMALTLFCATAIAQDASWMNEADNNQNPWQDGIVMAMGEGIGDPAKTRIKARARIFAMRAAEMDAKRNLLSTLKGVRISSGTVVKDMELESDKIAARVKGVLRGAYIVKRKVEFMEDAYVAQVHVAICLNQLNKRCQGKPNLASSLIRNVKKPATEDVYVYEPPKTESKLMQQPGKQSYSSLIVDASGLGIEPAMIARLLTKEGKEVYGMSQVNPNIVENQGMVRYVGNSDQAKALNVAGASPLQVRGVDTGPQGTSDVVISKDDAVKIYEVNLNSGQFLKQGKVIFIVN